MFQYFRNNGLDAVPHEVVQRGGQRNILQRNQFGISVSGPVVLPKIYNGTGKSFFTFSYEGTRERVGRSYLLTLPTAQQRLGDFSDLVNRAGDPLTVYDPAATRANALYDPNQPVTRENLEYEREAFPNNQIPETRIDRVARAVNAEYPLPNTNVGPFLRNNYWSNPSERSTPDGFIARVDHNLGDIQKITLNIYNSDGFQETPKIYPTAGNPGRPDRTFNNRGIELSDTVNLAPNLTYRGSFEAESSMTDTITDLSDQNFPGKIGLSGVNGVPFPSLRIRGYFGLGSPSRAFLRNVWNVYDLDNELIWRRGKHTWTTTSSSQVIRGNSLELESPSGAFSFDDRLSGLPGITNTGDGYATFLLGESYRAEATDQLQPVYAGRMSFQNALIDQWQILESLTMTLGANVDVTTPRVEQFDRQSTFDPDEINPATGTPGALVFAGKAGQGRAFQPVRMRLEPRMSLSWSPTSDRNTVIRSSYYRYYSPIGLRSGPFGTQGFSGRRFPISTNKQLAPAVVLEDGFPSLENPLPDLRGEFANDTNVDMIPNTSAQPTYNRLGVELERRFPRDLVVSARALTIRGRDLLISGDVAGVNRVPVSALSYRDQLNDESFRRSLRPYPQFQTVRMGFQSPGGKYRYDISEVKLQKRAGDGLSFDLEYGLRRRWDDYSGPGIQDPHDRSTAWSRSRGLRPHRVSVNYTYELPFGAGKPVLKGDSVIAKVMSDWSVSGFTTWLSGDPLVMETSFNNTGGIVPVLRVNSVDGVDPQVDNPGPEGWFNPAAFVDPDDFSLGNVPRTHATLRNPGYRNHDVSLTKRVAFTQQQSLEFLLQGFNFLNQANWNDPDTEIGPADARNKNAGKIIGSRGGRVLQLGLRYNF